MQRPTGITVVSVLFFAAALYLWTIGVVKLLAPDAVSLMSGSPLMYRLELAGPLHGVARGSRLRVRWLGIVSHAQLGALGRDAGDGDRRRVAGAKDFDGANSVFRCSGTDSRSPCGLRSVGIWRKRPRSLTRSPPNGNKPSRGSARIPADRFWTLDFASWAESVRSEARGFYSSWSSRIQMLR